MAQTTPVTRSQRTLRRRDFIRITALSGLALGLGTTLTRRLLVSGKLQQIEETRGAMGTYVRLVLISTDRAVAQQAIAATFDQIAHLESILSHHRADTALSALNESGRLHQPPAELVDVLRQAQRVSDWTNGAFDVTIQPVMQLVQQAVDRGRLPVRDELQTALSLVGYQGLTISQEQIAFDWPGMSITLDGIAKGYIVDSALDVLRRKGFAQAMVDAGGDIGGSPRADGSGWRVGVQDPRRTAGATIAVTRLAGGALATSGDYLHALTPDFSLHHILDPRHGMSPRELSSVSILAPSVCLADALSTTVMVLGRLVGMALVERLPGVEGLLVTKMGEVVASSGFPIDT